MGSGGDGEGGRIGGGGGEGGGVVLEEGVSLPSYDGDVCQGQRRFAIHAVLWVDVCAEPHQSLHRRRVPTARRQMKWGEPALREEARARKE